MVETMAEKGQKADYQHFYNVFNKLTLQGRKIRGFVVKDADTFAEHIYRKKVKELQLYSNSK